MGWRRALIAMVLIAGCGKSTTANVTPWFRVITNRVTVILPHALGFGESSQVAEVRVGGSWRQVAKGYQVLTIFPIDDAILVRDGAVDLVFHEGTEHPGVISRSDCPSSLILSDRPHFVCLGCGAPNALTSLDVRGSIAAACPVISAAERDLTGRVVQTFSGTTSFLPPSCQSMFPEGLTARGEPVVNIECTGRHHHLFAVRPGKLEEIHSADVVPSRSPWTPPHH